MLSELLSQIIVPYPYLELAVSEKEIVPLRAENISPWAENADLQHRLKLELVNF